MWSLTLLFHSASDGTTCVAHSCPNCNSHSRSLVYLHHVFVICTSSPLSNSLSSLSSLSLLSLYTIFTSLSSFILNIFPQYLSLISSCLALCLSHPISPHHLF